MSLKNKTAVVTGSTSGIGLGIARALAKQGATVMLNGLLAPEDAEKLRLKMASELNAKIEFHPANMKNPLEVANLMRTVEKQFGRIDILVNNAGIQHVAPIEDFPTEKWEDILAINLSSAFYTIQAALPSMRKNNWGRIINIASVHGHVASVNKSAYVASKHGLIGLTKVVALETAKTGVTCNAICPGWVLTPLIQNQIEALSKKDNISHTEAQSRLLSEKQPSHEFVSVEQIAETALFLCSEAGAQIRGTSINLDGGWLAQ